MPAEIPSGFDGGKAMRAAILIVAVLVAGLAGISPSEARQGYYNRHFYHHHYSHYLVRRHASYVHIRRHWSRHVRHYRSRRSAGLPGPCQVAASMGGPCGCWAEYVLLGRLDHVWRGINMWLANDWLRFPRAEPSPGTAVVWPGRHVAPVVAVHNDRTGRAVAVTTRESWGTRRVSLSGLVTVQPLGLYRRAPLVRYSSGSLG
jgi:hypothetical protein